MEDQKRHGSFDVGEERVIDGVSYTLVLFTQKAYETDADRDAVRDTGAALGLVASATHPSCCLQCADYHKDSCLSVNRLCGDDPRPVYVVRTAAVPLLALEGVLA